MAGNCRGRKIAAVTQKKNIEKNAKSFAVKFMRSYIHFY